MKAMALDPRAGSSIPSRSGIIKIIHNNNNGGEEPVLALRQADWSGDDSGLVCTGTLVPRPLNSTGQAFITALLSFLLQRLPDSQSRPLQWEKLCATFQLSSLSPATPVVVMDEEWMTLSVTL